MPNTEDEPVNNLKKNTLSNSDYLYKGFAVLQVRERGTLPFLALPLPFCQRLMPLRVVLQLLVDRWIVDTPEAGIDTATAVRQCLYFVLPLPS